MSPSYQLLYLQTVYVLVCLMPHQQTLGHRIKECKDVGKQRHSQCIQLWQQAALMLNMNAAAAERVGYYSCFILLVVISNAAVFPAYGGSLQLQPMHCRVSEMLEVMSKADRLQKCGSLKRCHSSPRSPPCQGIEFDRVNVIAPSGKLLARDLTFQVTTPLLLRCGSCSA